MKDEGKKNFKPYVIVILVILLIVIDQISKFYIVENIGKEIKNIIPNVLNFTYVENRGGAFGVGQNSTMMFVLVNIIILGIIIRFMMIQKDRIDRKTQVILSMILAGGISNLIDRIARGFVLDFIDFSPIISFPVFNIADILIVIGWVSLAIVTAVYYIKNKDGGKTNWENKLPF